ncbi:hypothetical protein AB0O67_03350 [Streptomyces sp. NPDC086077]|uniref:hypothetical protein n=1 Tax=Streptomyces sp. NPDC086077 TaxID=3154862 RepID=UPI00343CE3FE
MFKFKRAAVVAVAVAGLSTLGAGVSFAGDEEGMPPVIAEANSTADATAVGGDFVLEPEQEQEHGEHHEGEGE